MLIYNLKTQETKNLSFFSFNIKEEQNNSNSLYLYQGEIQKDEVNNLWFLTNHDNITSYSNKPINDINRIYVTNDLKNCYISYVLHIEDQILSILGEAKSNKIYFIKNNIIEFDNPFYIIYSQNNNKFYIIKEPNIDILTNKKVKILTFELNGNDKQIIYEKIDGEKQLGNKSYSFIIYQDCKFFIDGDIGFGYDNKKNILYYRNQVIKINNIGTYILVCLIFILLLIIFYYSKDIISKYLNN